jgi:futalosine hydrolase
MKILLVSATSFEVRPFINRLIPVPGGKKILPGYRSGKHTVDILIAGIGIMKTAWILGKTLSHSQYDLALNAGIGGAYDPAIPVGSVAHVTEDCIPEMGAEDESRFVSVFDLGLEDPDEFPFTGGKLINNTFPVLPCLADLPEVKGNTVNTIRMHPGKISEFRERFPADVETMEGAAFFYACFMEKTPCVQIRAISNYVAERDRSKWDVDLALRNLNETLRIII